MYLEIKLGKVRFFEEKEIGRARADIVIDIDMGAGSIVPHNAMADSLMDEISSFIETNTEAIIMDESREVI